MKFGQSSIVGKGPLVAPVKRPAKPGLWAFLVHGRTLLLHLLRELGSILAETYRGWVAANGTLLAAGLSYYTIFSVMPLLVLAVSVTGMIFSEKAVTDQLVQEISAVISERAANAVRMLVENNHILRGSGWAAIFGAVIMMVTASLMFVHMKRAINLMWGIAPHPEKKGSVLIRTHFLSFVMVFVVILMLLGLMVANTLIVTLNQRFVLLPQALGGYWPDSDFTLTFIGFTLLFAVIFKVLPDARTAWRDVLIGAAATSFLSTSGGFLLGFYLGHVNLYSIYGATSSVLLIMVWIYFSMQIILYGAKLTQVIANRYGSQVLPSNLAARIIHSLEILDSEEYNAK